MDWVHISNTIPSWNSIKREGKKETPFYKKHKQEIRRQDKSNLILETGKQKNKSLVETFPPSMRKKLKSSAFSIQCSYSKPDMSQHPHDIVTPPGIPCALPSSQRVEFQSAGIPRFIVIHKV